ncbi:MAG: hypothetical protein D6722_29330 [Bacteroidetes bacterium]|nr:MAG: hypothetical protein D6722_29330 [Bacteroidota bacterium]
MSKLSQLETLRRLGLPTAAFCGLSYADFRAGQWPRELRKMRFPVAVRSSYGEEDGQEKAHAGEFETRLFVGQEELEEAVAMVFASYPSPDDQMVIIQEMVDSDYSGVLFAYREGVWKVEFVEGQGEQLVSGQVAPQSLLLPRFVPADRWWASRLRRWRPFGADRRYQSLVGPLLQLSIVTGQLLAEAETGAPLGLDIEFAVARRQLYVLQARPITTPNEAEELLTSANHKEILPPRPSQMMTAVIQSCSAHLFAYYQRLDPSLPTRNFIEVSAGMPWINLSALLDAMVSWGLPSSLVCESVGAEDVYRVKLRPYRSLRKWTVFVRLLKEQLSVVGRTHRWVRAAQKSLLYEISERRLMWRNNPELAFNNWLTNLQLVYVDLVSHMQALTGAMSGPIKVLARMGRLPRVSGKSESTRYLEAFRAMQAGTLSRSDFLKSYGHRGFYESDIGQKRFSEYSEKDWDQLSFGEGLEVVEESIPAQTERPSLFTWIARPFIRMMLTREWLRHHAMRYFAMLREEIQEQTRSRFGESFDFARYRPEDLTRLLEGSIDLAELEGIAYGPQAGWEPDTFLRNRDDRRLPISHLVNGAGVDEEGTALGIYPGQVRGQIWRVQQADLQAVRKPDFPRTILLTESLDPGWVPYFVQVDGVLSHVGGILSHGSIMLRESRIPAITRVPRTLDLQTGDWVEMDGRTGQIRKLDPAEREI